MNHLAPNLSICISVRFWRKKKPIPDAYELIYQPIRSITECFEDLIHF